MHFLLEIARTKRNKSACKAAGATTSCSADNSEGIGEFYILLVSYS
jgi:hypothetical protein